MSDKIPDGIQVALDAKAEVTDLPDELGNASNTYDKPARPWLDRTLASVGSVAIGSLTGLVIGCTYYALYVPTLPPLAERSLLHAIGLQNVEIQELRARVERLEGKQ